MDFLDRQIQEEGLYVYNVHNIVEKHFSVSVTPVRSQVAILAIKAC
jgi:hypothetical protein